MTTVRGQKQGTGQLPRKRPVGGRGRTHVENGVSEELESLEIRSTSTVPRLQEKPAMRRQQE